MWGLVALNGSFLQVERLENTPLQERDSIYLHAHYTKPKFLHGCKSVGEENSD